ncbi:hypothetical protein SAMN05660479_02354 [Microbulbifer thermotolerans]|uniref:NADAR family protein n=1 Tax=Microbulbifer thermotolerans TaxID=252514 RepID=UPI0008F0BE8A|nr:NADAR family protein [Microbulbifer thermotolerans]SFC74662.1 hypothetical protein SAMN05660479_02354 [Microbulbifer thermotolerans]
MKIRTKEELVEFVNYGNRVKYIFFWGHKEDSKVTKACFSQWYESSFEIDGVRFLTAEHFMMAKKAELFDDIKSYNKIISSKNPGEAKRLGREVKGFDESVWIDQRFEIVVQANFAKFSQNEDLKSFLLATGNRVLVEASPVDRIWGIGLSADDEAAENPNRWRGLNLLGFALMEVRDRLRPCV